MNVNEKIALQRYSAGEEPTFSTGICDSLTCGYGRLSNYGYWEFPLYPAEDYLKQKTTAQQQHEQELSEARVLPQGYTLVPDSVLLEMGNEAERHRLEIRKLVDKALSGEGLPQ